MYERAVYDIETNGFLNDFDTIHCLVLYDMDTEEMTSCADQPGYTPIAEGLELLAKYEKRYGHNTIRFDKPAIKKLYPDYAPKGTEVDTIVATRLRFAHIKASDFARAKKGTLPTHLIGRQSIEAWGYRLGVLKTDYKTWCEKNGIEEPFAIWRKEMQDYCEDDVMANVALVEKLREAGVPADALSVDLDVAEYLAQQERNGWPIDEEHLAEFVADLSQRKLELEETLIEHFGQWYEPKDDMEEGWTPKVNNSRYGYVKGAPCVRLEVKEFNPGSRDQIAERLITLYGWKPTAFTPTGKPQVDESTLAGLTTPMGDELNEYLLVTKRLGQVVDGKQGWVGHLDGDQYQGGKLTGMRHIHHSVSQVTVTHRARHSHPNLGQVPKVGSPYGEESRATFTVPPKWKLVGSDADGLELRCLAHYMAKYDDGAYGRAILEGSKADGTDIHSMNANALDLIRDDAKTWIYAWLYGAGNTKLGSISHPDADEEFQSAEGKKQKARFLKRTPALKLLKDAVDRAAEQKGYVLLPDGRPAFIRHKHAALNTLLQGAGAVIIKHWIWQLNEALMEEFNTPPGGGWEFPWAAVGWIHDEVQEAVREEYAETAAGIIVRAMPPVAVKFNWRIPLAASADIGNNWAETH